MKSWIFLISAGLLEVVWAISLKHADGFTRTAPSILALAAAAASFALLSLSLKTLPVGTAYAVWVGIGAGGVALLGMLSMGESGSTPRLVCLGLVLIGVIGLKVFDG